MTNPAETSPVPGPEAALAAVLDWWREAGVDHAYSDDPRTWLADLAEPEPAEPQRPAVRSEAPPPPAPPPVARIAGTETLPATLESFVDWWLSEPSLDGGHVTRRIAPRGKPGAPLMVLIDHPEVDDADRLLSGPQGRLLDAMLAAMGLGPDAVYLASCLPRHMPLPDWEALGAAGLGEAVRHHVMLARPQRLLVLGRHVLPLLGHDPTKTAEPLRRFNHEGLTIPLLGVAGLALLASKPRSKALVWQAWLDWIGPDWTGQEPA